MEKIEDGNLIGPINRTVMVDALLVTGKRVWPSMSMAMLIFNMLTLEITPAMPWVFHLVHSWLGSGFWLQRKSKGRMMDTGYSVKQGKVIKWVGRILFVLFASDNNYWVVHPIVTPEQGWVHVTVTWRRCVEAKQYINGEMADTSGTARSITDPILCTTCFNWGNDCLHRVTWFDGIVDELDGWVDWGWIDWWTNILTYRAPFY